MKNNFNSRAITTISARKTTKQDFSKKNILAILILCCCNFTQKKKIETSVSIRHITRKKSFLGPFLALFGPQTSKLFIPQNNHLIQFWVSMPMHFRQKNRAPLARKPQRKIFCLSLKTLSWLNPCIKSEKLTCRCFVKLEKKTQLQSIFG